ncbi:MAG TPA: transketolase C-terminal domain-containing protein, partial [Candidatus Polarisedimenticolaceae bacterium]|nr:transketolase C-terminal domain-containing protein [Candidatus Polarisedimenticolaceae bacterium]
VDELTAKLDAAEWEPLGSATAYRAPEQPLFRDSSELVLADGDAAGGRRVNDLLNGGLHELMAADPDVMVLGEDLLDPYGGAFKVTKGLSTAYPDRVFSTPISEAAIVGFGNGWSLAGGKAVVEIMFGDFAALAVDQIVNQAAKMHFMYGGKVCVPVTVRLVSGGYRGYGPTHSQSLESLFCGVPGLEVVALSRRHDPRALLGAAVGRDPNPVLFVENKLIYSMRVHTGAPAGFRFVPGRAPSGSVYPSLRFTTTEPGAAADVTVVTYGGMTDMVEEAMEQLILDEELEFDYFVLSQLSPLSVDDVVASVTVTKRLVTVEEGPRRYGVGTEVVSRVAEALPGQSIRVALVGAEDLPIPNSRVQETDVLPSRERIVGAIRRVWS